MLCEERDDVVVELHWCCAGGGGRPVESESEIADNE